MSTENTGSMFGLHGIGGMLVAVVLLLSIVAVLTTIGLGIQQQGAVDPYIVEGDAVANPQTKEDVWANLRDLKMIDPDNARPTDAQ